MLQVACMLTQVIGLFVARSNITKILHQVWHFQSLQNRAHNPHISTPLWRHQTGTISALLALCEGNSPVTGEFPPQRPVTRSFADFFDLRMNKRLSQQQWRRWFETPSCSLYRHCNVMRYQWDGLFFAWLYIILYCQATGNKETLNVWPKKTLS